MTLPTSKTERKERPMARGLLDYFPDALAEVAHVSYVGNQQHNPGEELHWAREKSTDHADCIIRHLADRGRLDDDGMRHSAKVAWRALAMLQLELEKHTQEQNEEVRFWTNVENAYGPTAEDAARWDTQFVRALNQQGCLPSVIGAIMGGVSSNVTHVREEVTRLYIAGPMRGHPHHNFPAFDEARDLWLAKDTLVISPADIDRAAGDTLGGSQHSYAYRDFFAIFCLLRPRTMDGLVMLPGWETSRGASAEFAMAVWLGLNVYDLTGNLICGMMPPSATEPESSSGIHVPEHPLD